MLALSIQQPWAWAIFSHPPRRPPNVRAKDVENRKWFTDHSGWLYIHAGKTYDEAGQRWMRKTLGVHAPDEIDCQRGGLIGIVRLVTCSRDWRSPWFGGPWGFVLADAYPLPFEPCAGQLQLFDISRAPSFPSTYTPP